MFKQCIECDLKYPHTTESLCEFCRIVKYNNKYDVFNYILCISDLSQEDIIKITFEIFKKCNKIPTPEEVDPSCIKLQLNPYIYRLKNDAAALEKLNIVIFYTNALDRNKLKIKKIGQEFKTEMLDIESYCSNKKNINNIIKPSSLRTL